MLVYQTSMPWINGDLKKKIRRNNRLFKSRKKSQKHRSNFLKNRRNLQKQMRQARWGHINGTIGNTRVSVAYYYFYDNIQLYEPLGKALLFTSIS